MLSRHRDTVMWAHEACKAERTAVEGDNKKKKGQRGNKRGTRGWTRDTQDNRDKGQGTPPHCSHREGSTPHKGHTLGQRGGDPAWAEPKGPSASQAAEAGTVLL